MIDLRLSQLEVNILDRIMIVHGPVLYDHRSFTVLIESSNYIGPSEHHEENIVFKIKAKKNLNI